jgi:hypothetical protein
MHRWPLAIFALHFVLSVSAFAFGETAGSLLPRIATAQVSASVHTPSDTISDSTVSVTSSALSDQHGLMDDLPDLPDTLTRIALPARQVIGPTHAIGYLAACLVPCSPDALLRPPRTLL